MTQEEMQPSQEQQPDAQQQPAPPAETGDDNWQARHDELYNQYLRLSADFDNFRKRQAQEQLATRQYGAQGAVEELLPVLDNLERAMASLNEGSDAKILFQSLRLMQNQLSEALRAIGLEPLQAMGQPFDPQLHEAVGQEPRDDVSDHSVVQVQQAGYRFKDRILRPAMVVVAISPGGEASPQEPATGAEEAQPQQPVQGMATNDDDDTQPVGSNNPFARAAERMMGKKN